MSLNKKDKFWNSLKTTSAFDRGPENYLITNSTQPLNEDAYKITSPTASTPISVLVQSLIQQLCRMLENDRIRASKLYDSICERLCQLKLIDESYAMGEFEVMRHQYQQALCQLVNVANGTDTSVLCKWPIYPESNLEWSRYSREFDEMIFISGGGFGKVYKAKHRLDGIEYAIKKICIQSSDISSVMNHFAEVKTFASLNHPNIVSYKAAWLEPLIEPQRLNNIKEHSEFHHERINISVNASSESEDSYLSQSIVTRESNDSNFDICFEEESISEVGSDSNSNNCKVLVKANNYSEENQAVVPHANLKWAILYIQMELCQKTLKSWLEERNSLISELNISTIPENFTYDFHTMKNGAEKVACAHVPTVLEIITQIGKAIEYIHQKNIIHHDVKPSNIFISMDTNKFNVQLADFGLACPLQKCHKGIALGTELYAAPEQLNGKCNAKSDIFSLGMVFLEMLEIFTTDMEKVKVFQQLKNSHIPERITANFPKLTEIIKQLIINRPDLRLTATDFLQLIKKLKNNKDNKIRLLEEELLAKDMELAAKDEEIDRLKKELASINVTSKT